MTEFHQLVTVEEMKLGDVVEVFDGPWSTAIVRKIEDGNVTFFRPYGTHADFTCTAGVICYTGTEEFTMTPMSGKRYKLWRRAENLK